MAVAFESADSVNTGGSSVSSLTITDVTLTGSNRTLDAFTAHRAGTERETTSVERTGEADTYTEAKNGTKSGNAKGELFGSTNEPVLGPANLVGTINSANTSWCFGYMACTGVNQTTRINGIVEDADGADPTSVSVDVTSAVGDLVCTALARTTNGGAISLTGTGHTQRTATSQGTGNADLVMGTVTGATSVTAGYSWSTGTGVDADLIGWNHPSAETAPSAAVPGDGICINIYGETAVAGISVTEGTSSITSVATSCTAGATLTYDTTGTSVTISGNGTNAATLSNGASEAEYNTVLGTLTMRGTTVDTTITVTIIPTDGTLSDNQTFDVFCDPFSLTATGTNANVIAWVASIQARVLAGQTTDTVSVNVVDDTGGTPLEADSSFIVALESQVNPPSNDGSLVVLNSTRGVTDVIM